ncbi:MAG: PCRF domain-containing protein [Patescibacteria group bacterium]
MTEVSEEIKRLEQEMLKPDFWQDKEKAQVAVKELNRLKDQSKAGNKYDKGDAVISIYSGAGGDDAEDWARILFEMYKRHAERAGWNVSVIHEHRNETGGYKNITFRVGGKSVYGSLKKESGVHRLVRISPFSAKKLRHTSFALVEVMPKFVDPGDAEIKPEDIEVQFAKSSGPGGQNVNKRETAVRVIHKPTGIQAHSEAGRSQAQNREEAMELLRARLYNMKVAQDKKEIEELRPVSGKGTAEWGHQIRSYVFHPYKMVKDHRTEVETSNVEAVLNGELDQFIEAELKI